MVHYRNDENVTAESLFARTNEALRTRAVEWLRHTSEGCSVLAVLIATVAFAAAYTIPGGPNQSTGLPVLLSQPLFLVFTGTDVLSLTFALSAVVIFLSILTAPFRLIDFKDSLPNKLMFGFTCLFLSISMMMISFSATIVLMISSKQRWTKIILYSISFFPVAIFALAYLPLYISLSQTLEYLVKKLIQGFKYYRLPFLSKETQNTSYPIEHQPQSSSSTRHNPEREESCSLDATQTSHSSV
jgi:hypothetical protein